MARKKIALVGDSAGAGLVMALVAELLRDWKSYAQRNNIVTTAEGRPVSPALVRKP